MSNRYENLKDQLCFSVDSGDEVAPKHKGTIIKKKLYNFQQTINWQIYNGGPSILVKDIHIYISRSEIEP